MTVFAKVVSHGEGVTIFIEGEDSSITKMIKTTSQSLAALFAQLTIALNTEGEFNNFSIDDNQYQFSHDQQIALDETIGQWFVDYADETAPKYTPE